MCRVLGRVWGRICIVLSSQPLALPYHNIYTYSPLNQLLKHLQARASDDEASWEAGNQLFQSPLELTENPRCEPGARNKGASSRTRAKSG